MPVDGLAASASCCRRQSTDRPLCAPRLAGAAARRPTTSSRARDERAVLGSMLADLSDFLTPLLRRLDRTRMGASVECRVPFLDQRLVHKVDQPAARLAAAAPARTSGCSRRIAARYLPAQIWSRGKKMGFPLPLARLPGPARRHRALRGRVLRASARLQPPRPGRGWCTLWAENVIGFFGLVTPRDLGSPVLPAAADRGGRRADPGGSSASRTGCRRRARNQRSRHRMRRARGHWVDGAFRLRGEAWRETAELPRDRRRQIGHDISALLFETASRCLYANSRKELHYFACEHMKRCTGGPGDRNIATAHLSKSGRTMKRSSRLSLIKPRSARSRRPICISRRSASGSRKNLGDRRSYESRVIRCRASAIAPRGACSR